jgi:hypothetical protein
MNALKSGLYASPLLVKTEFYSEDEGALREREAQLRAQFCPEGGLEEMCIQQILFHYQCIHRANAYETGCLEIDPLIYGEQLSEVQIKLRDEIETTVRNLELQKTFLADLESIQDMDLWDFDNGEIDYINTHGGLRISPEDEEAWHRSEKLCKWLFFVRGKLGWTDHFIHSLLVQLRREAYASAESKLDELRSALRRETESVAEQRRNAAPKRLLVDPETFEKIERSRSSHLKHLHRAVEMLMKLQAFGIQKKRLEGVPLLLESRSN